MLSDKTLAILGAGMMGGALVRGLVQAGAMPPGNIRLFDAVAGKAAELAKELGLDASAAASSATEAVKGADIVLLAVKPPVVPQVLGALKGTLTSAQIVISIAAGVRLAAIEPLLPAGTPAIRVMPNTPALIGAGAAIAPGVNATPEHIALSEALFSAVGVAVVLDEKLLDAVTGLSGSGPAYVFLFIEALIDGGVKQGLPRDAARKLAAQTVYGAAKMVLDSPDHPGKLKDNVTTPGGTTIAGLAALERAGLRAALIDAVEAATVRSKELG